MRADEAVQWDRSVLPIAPKPFAGHVGLRTAESKLDFPAEVKAPDGAPNILLIMPDDVGGSNREAVNRHSRNN